MGTVNNLISSVNQGAGHDMGPGTLGAFVAASDDAGVEGGVIKSGLPANATLLFHGFSLATAATADSAEYTVGVRAVGGGALHTLATVDATLAGTTDAGWDGDEVVLVGLASNLADITEVGPDVNAELVATYSSSGESVAPAPLVYYYAYAIEGGPAGLPALTAALIGVLDVRLPGFSDDLDAALK